MRGLPPNCLKCLHFKITGDPALPYSCLTFEIQCLRLPSVEVFLNTGRQCPVFELNPSIKEEDSDHRPLDKKGWLA